jgi:hypothetical protein
MGESGVTEDKEGFVMKEPTAALEKRYIEEYLYAKGFSLQSLHELLPERAKQLMREASLYASNKLAEVEKRAHMMQDLRGPSS